MSCRTCFYIQEEYERNAGGFIILKKLILTAMLSSLLTIPAYGQSESPVVTVGLHTEAVSGQELMRKVEKAQRQIVEACIEDMAERCLEDGNGVSSYTEEDLEILAHLLAGECQSYPDREQLLVGSVVLNRVKNPNYPNTVKGVVFQKGQYACTWDGNYYRKPTERNRANAKWLLENGSILPENVVYQSGGRQGSGVYIKTAYHYFCYR